MRRLILPAALACLALSSLLSFAQEKGYWRAASSNAGSITGDIEISDTRLSINFTNFTLAPIRRLSPAETSAVFASEPTSAGGNLYRVNVPAKQRFLHKNSLCGNDDTQCMLTSVADRTMHVAFFSGPDTPVFTPEALVNSSDQCGTFAYVR